MRVLLDHNIPVPIMPLLIGHEVDSTRALHWDLLRNGRLIAAAETSGFQVLLSGDKKMISQYTNLTFSIGIVLVGNTTVDVLTAYLSDVLQAIAQSTSGVLTVVPMPGTRDFRKQNPRKQR